MGGRSILRGTLLVVLPLALFAAILAVFAVTESFVLGVVLAAVIGFPAGALVMRLSAPSDDE